jgi:hypothetical protein
MNAAKTTVLANSAAGRAVRPNILILWVRGTPTA